jgi:hypothetical protein
MSLLPRLMANPHPASELARGRVAGSAALPPRPNATYLSFEQTLDHFNYADDRSFSQRILWNDQYWGQPTGSEEERVLMREALGLADDCPGPVFFYSGNESPVTDYWNASGNAEQVWAPTYGGLLIMAEFRYFGATLPFGNESFTNDNLRYLTTDQALGDYAHFLQTLKLNGTIPESCPIISYGGSFGGMLSLWFRMKYPHIIAGSIAASAPVAFVGSDVSPYAFMDSCEQTFATAADGCNTKIGEAQTKMVEMGNTDAGRKQLSSIYRTCDPIKTPAESMALLEYVQSALVTMAMLDYPYPTDYGVKLPAFPVNETCRIVANGASSVEGLAEAIENVYWPLSSGECLDISTDNPSFATGDGWPYLACTEIFLVSDLAQRGMWQPETTLNLTAQVEACREQFDVELRYNWSNTQFYGFDVSAGSNVYLSNGALDPWSSSGFTTAPNPTMPVGFAYQAAHHLDLRAPNPADGPWIQVVRDAERDAMLSWVAEWSARFTQ